MKPEIVVVKDVNGRALRRWMVGATGAVAIITNDEGARAVLAGREPEHSVGFPKMDVFEAIDMRIEDGDRPNWAEFRGRF